ncbi:Rpn family recombination-promoting nuclease/putative transposase [Salmonella enterica]|nr:Rpn family recombination-promoting nuclease/putative transposase [Salmonella enterica]EDW4356315.1 Rpn family recombination-promoting nuclease/putative transposase [Salmonella enterica subsp. salamae]HCM1881220.1 Rpn family recombination-promoting nuclease/putative transposase [Salmonella enterica subsp. salamae serovar 60:z10:z39]EAX8454120.1 Rpn family recombination-promoting nuclease/putative transposase [Salmonella enterica]EAX8554216.1 Rpn family recombination-promoting nuclease/putativ
MRKNRTPTPHDLEFKTFLSTMETARDFITLHLPPALLQLCDLQTLQLESGSFIEEDLHPYYSDMLYSLKTACGDGYIHVLTEHQSSPDKHMAFRLMRYAIAAMQRHLEAGHKTLPLVIPILFYQGRKSPWPYSMNWLDNFADPALARRIYSQSFTLVDITAITDDEIMRHRSMAALTLIQKHIRQRDLTQLLDKLASLLIQNHMSGQQVIALVNYMLQAGEAQDARTLLYEMAQRAPQYGDELMTLAEQLKQEGRIEGMQTGEREASRKIARAMLEKGIPMVDIIEMTGVSAEELPSLQH